MSLMSSRFTARRAPSPDVPAQPAEAPIESSLLAKLPAEPKDRTQPASDNPLLSDKFLDAKVRLHRRLIEEINLSALEK